ncbi:TIGR03899 family protein [Alkalimonas sp. MEB108]|uniref:TIGR03899 family protein n=1 Tax=Alkalimonas cellulosilytica TaxID=3058395 RepID=A0ABU7J417_9GAMM|nr:TIGR03899 family protein [Alkalimonas sp. MEB108]MEE2001127.1 TIGR03899 family protein [Alkalimonas sp. MEB108]
MMSKLSIQKTSHQPVVATTPVPSGNKPSSQKVTGSGNKVKRSQRFFAKYRRLAAYAGVQLSQQTGLDQLPLPQRLQRRLRMQQERQQLNLERIIALSADYAPEQVGDTEVDPDWFHHYCELALNIANPSMQQLWAKILACEIAAPGQFSLKTLYMLKQMSHKEALALQQAASLCCRNSSEGSGRIYFGVFRRPSLFQLLTGRGKALLNLSQYKLSYPDILSLMDTGLLHHAEIESGELAKGDSIVLSIQQQRLQCTARHNGLVLQYYKFSPLGDELLPLLNIQPQPHYLEALQQLLSNHFDVSRYRATEDGTSSSD